MLSTSVSFSQMESRSNSLELFLNKWILCFASLMILGFIHGCRWFEVNLHILHIGVQSLLKLV